MKVTLDLECTPEEARRFMGLPDLSPLHEAYVERFRSNIEQGLTPDTLHGMVQSWAPMGEAGVALWKQLFERAVAQVKTG